jgi:hypothetical protein
MALPVGALLGAITTVALVIWRRRRGDRATEAGPLVAAGVALAVVSPMAWTGMRRDLTHISFVAAFGLVGLALALAPLRRWRGARVGIAIAFLLPALAGTASFAHKTKATWAASRARATFRENFYVMYPLARTIESHTKPTDTIVMGWLGGWASWYTGRRSASPHIYIGAPVANPFVYFTQEMWREIADAIVARRPKMLFFFDQQWPTLVRVRPDLATRYAPGVAAGLYWPK